MSKATKLYVTAVTDVSFTLDEGNRTTPVKLFFECKTNGQVIKIIKKLLKEDMLGNDGDQLVWKYATKEYQDFGRSNSASDFYDIKIEQEEPISYLGCMQVPLTMFD